MPVEVAEGKIEVGLLVAEAGAQQLFGGLLARSQLSGGAVQRAGAERGEAVARYARIAALVADQCMEVEARGEPDVGGGTP